MVAARLANLGHGGDRRSKTKSPIGDLKRVDAARLLNVAPRTVERSRAVLEHGAPELVRAVESGEKQRPGGWCNLALLARTNERARVRRPARGPLVRFVCLVLAGWGRCKPDPPAPFWERGELEGQNNQLAPVCHGPLGLNLEWSKETSQRFGFAVNGEWRASRGTRARW